MSDHSLFVLSVLVELGLPLGMTAWCVAAPRIRSRAFVILGAVIPFLLGYGYVVLQYFWGPAEQFTWAVWAMWSMSLAPFIACAAGGLALSWLPRPRPLIARWLMGLVSPMAVGILVVAGL